MPDNVIIPIVFKYNANIQKNIIEPNIPVSNANVTESKIIGNQIATQAVLATIVKDVVTKSQKNIVTVKSQASQEVKRSLVLLSENKIIYNKQLQKAYSSISFLKNIILRLKQDLSQAHLEIARLKNRLASMPSYENAPYFKHYANKIKPYSVPFIFKPENITNKAITKIKPENLTNTEFLQLNKAKFIQNTEKVLKDNSLENSLKNINQNENINFKIDSQVIDDISDNNRNQFPGE